MSASSHSSTAVASSATASRYHRDYYERDHDLASIGSGGDGISASSVVSASSHGGNRGTRSSSVRPGEPRRRGGSSEEDDGEDDSHHERAEQRKHEEARAAIVATLESAGSAYDAAYQRRAVDLHANTAVLERQQRDVESAAQALGRESGKWRKEVDRMTRGLNEFGDLQNWAEMMEHDLLVLEETLRLVDGRADVESASGGSQWREPSAQHSDAR